AASTEGVYRSWGLFHTCECDEHCSKDYARSGVQTQSRKKLLSDSEGKFCLV
ncbi:unnamed protein product, partial [Bubo scandiacus]